MEDRKKRKSNFSDSEIKTLIEKYDQHKYVITSKQSNTITNKRKKETWKSITASIKELQNSADFRTVEEVKKKWQELLSKAKKDAGRMKRVPTGGGPLPKASIYSKTVIQVVGENSPAFIGLEGMDSAAQSLLNATSDSSASVETDTSYQEEENPTAVLNVSVTSDMQEIQPVIISASPGGRPT